MKILSRYVLKEHVGPLIFALSALTSLLLLNYVAKQFGALVGKGLPWTAIAEFFLLSIPFTVELTLPMAVLVATLHAFSRLAAENEITALKASGVSLRRLMTPVMIAAVGVTVFMLLFNDQVIPRSNHELAVLQSDIAQKKPTFALREQVINEVSPGKLFLRANHLDEGSNRMRDVTIYDLSEATRRRTIYADSGDMALARNQTDLLMTLYHGTMQDVPTANPAQLQRLFFNVDLITVKGVANQFQQSANGQSKGNREMSVCEMQREVQKSRTEYVSARNEFLREMKVARSNGEKLDPALNSVSTRIPSNITLGGLYCSLMRELRVPTLGAQVVGARPVRAPNAVGISPVAQAAQSAKRATPIGKITAAPGTHGAAAGAVVATPPVPQPALAPSAGLGPTPSSIEVARIRMLDARTAIDSNEIEIHKKFALAVACFVFVLLGAPIALRFPRGGVGLTIGVSLLVFALYYIGLTAGAAAAAQGLLPPVVAMWAANVIFGLVAVLLMARMGREGATARGGDMRETLSNIRASITAKLRTHHIMSDRRADA